MPTNSPSSPSQRAQSPSIAASTPTRGALPENRGAVFARLLAEQLEARRRDDGGADVSFASRLAASSAIDTSEPVAIKVTSRPLLRLDDDIGAERDQIGFVGLLHGTSAAPAATGTAPTGWSLRRSAQSQASARLDRVGRAEHQQVRDRPQRCEMLDRLMRRTVLAEADRIMRHHMDDADAHQRGQPDRGPAVVGEG